MSDMKKTKGAKSKRVSLSDKQLRPEVGSELASDLPITRTPMTLSINDIDLYEKNPRRSRNPHYAEIKESIRQKGRLDNSFSVTKRPGDENYIVKAGGNTRLAILKELYGETGDERFLNVHVIFVPYVSESDNLVSHLIENEMRGDLNLIDRARGLRDTRAEFEKERGMTFSDRELSAVLKEAGYSISRTIINLLNYALDRLYPHIPVYLDAGMGKAQVEKIRKFENQAKQSWKDMEVNLEQFDEVFTAALAACTDEIEDDSTPRFDFDDLVEHFCKGTAKANAIGLAQVQFFVDRAMNVPRRPPKEELEQDEPQVVESPSVQKEPTPDDSHNETTVNETADDESTVPFASDLDDELEQPSYEDDEDLDQISESGTQAESYNPNKEAPTLSTLRSESLAVAIELAEDVGIEDLIITIDDGYGWILANVPKPIHFPNGFVETEQSFKDIWRVWQLLFSLSGACEEDNHAMAATHITESNNDLKRALTFDFESITSDSGLYLSTLSIMSDFWLAGDDGQVKKAMGLMKLQRQIKRLAKAINADLWEGGCDE